MSEVALDIETIYQYASHRNLPWNIVEYEPVRQYLDPRAIATERERKAGGTQTQRYITKRSSFLDQHIKQLKDMPAPCAYSYHSQFEQTDNIKEGKRHKINFKLKKNTYLEQIQALAKRYKSPGVGQYRPYKDHSKTNNKRISSDAKRFYYQDSEFLSTEVPGAGCYYPHQNVSHIRKERTNHHFWKSKHQQEESRDRKRSLKETDPGTYRPLSASFNTFDKMKVNDERLRKKEGNRKPHHGFGSSDAKFDYNRSHKNKGESKPDPCLYNTMIDWKGKNQDAKKNNWVRCVSAGPTRGVYH